MTAHIIEGGEKSPKHRKKTADCADLKHPPPEDELGGGDFCSLEESPSTDDDKPLD
jgi:hypothetical protein